MTITEVLGRWCREIRDNLRKNHLWQHVIRYTVAVTCTVILTIIPAVSNAYGPSTFMAPLVAVFGNAGQRLGQMTESTFLVTSGVLLGVGWAVLGMYLSSLVSEVSAPAAYSIRAVFLAAAAVFHGYLRSSSPRLFNFVLFLLIPCIVILLGTAQDVTAETATQILYPSLSASVILLLVNVTILPQFSGDFLGTTTIETLALASEVLRDATTWFIAPIDQPGDTARDGADAVSSSQKSLASLTDRKSRMRAKVKSCRAALDECIYELSFSVLPPKSLKPISKTGMSNLVHSTVALMGACESKYALMEKTSFREGGGSATPSMPSSPSTQRARPLTAEEGARRSADEPEEDSDASSGRFVDRVKMVKPHREIEKADAAILNSILLHLRPPVQELQVEIENAVRLMTVCLAYCYDVSRLPSGALPPKGIHLDEIDVRVDSFSKALSVFEKASADAIASAAAEESSRAANSQLDIMPRTETFLMSSFLLSLRQSADHMLVMLRHVRVLVERRHAKHGRKRVYLPKKMNWKKWLSSGGERDATVLPETARQEARAGKDIGLRNLGNDAEDQGMSDEEFLPEPADEENNMKSISAPHRPRKAGKKKPVSLRRNAPEKRGLQGTRERAADIVDGVLRSDDLKYAAKLAVAVFLCSFPAVVESLNSWYSSARGVWAPLQLVLVFEVAVGTSFWVFLVRAAGVFYGCLWGYLSYEIGRGNLIAIVVVLVFGIVPSAYVQLGTKYIKAGMISVVSMTVIALASTNHSGTAWENYLKRLAAFMVGGTVALVIEVALYPAKARDRLVECLSNCIHHISGMEASIAAGVDKPLNVDLHDSRMNVIFNLMKGKAETALSAAETFLPFCLNEPRLKGNFRAIEPIYKEIIYVLHQIIDRMDNIVQLRNIYGSAVLEELNADVYIYRRNVAASVTLTLFAVNEALTTRLPLPQFLPSSRLAQLRLVNRVREVLNNKSTHDTVVMNVLDMPPGEDGIAPAVLDEDTIKSVTQQKFLSWNAAAAGQMEIIEYLEELVDLTKLLVGVNAFRSGLLERPSYRQYINKIRAREISVAQRATAAHVRGGSGEPLTRIITARSAILRRRRKTTSAGHGDPADVRGFRETWDERHAPMGSAVDDEQELDEVPASLERVGERLRQDRRIIRSMSMSEAKSDMIGRGGFLR